MLSKFEALSGASFFHAQEFEDCDNIAFFIPQKLYILSKLRVLNYSFKLISWW